MNKETKIIFNILKYSFILEYLLTYNSIFSNEYKIKLFKELIKINNNYSYLLTLNNDKLKIELNKIIKAFFNEIIN